MRNGLGEPQSLAVVGGTSQIGLAIAAALADSGRLRAATLAGRDPDALAAAASQLGQQRISSVRCVRFDAATPDTHDQTVREMFDDGDLDVVVLAAGQLGGADDPLDHVDEAVQLTQVNYVAGVSMALRVASRLRQQGHGVLVVLSSVAGRRGRASNYVYGSTKAGLDVMGQGLGDRLRGDGVTVLVVRPGFIRGRMTAGRRPPPLSRAPQDVGRAVADAVRHGRQTVWVPAVLGVAVPVLSALPRAVFRRLPL